jgi:hypothetical protein
MSALVRSDIVAGLAPVFVARRYIDIYAALYDNEPVRRAVKSSIGVETMRSRE